MIQIKGRVMIDPRAFYQSDSESANEKGFPELDYSLEKEEVGITGCQCDTCKNQPSPVLQFQGYDNLDPKESPPPDEEQFYMLCDERVFAYTLKERRWGRAIVLLCKGHSDNACLDPVSVEEVREVREIEKGSSFAKLVLDPELKSIIKALTASYGKDPLRPSLVSTDCIQGKGEGKIILLHG